MTRDALTAVLSCTVLLTVLLAAYVAGEHRRCESLRKDGSPLVATYCEETSR